MEYQGRGIRFVSLLIDGLIISAVFWAVVGIFGMGAMRPGVIPWYWGLLSFAFYIA